MLLNSVLAAIFISAVFVSMFLLTRKLKQKNKLAQAEALNRWVAVVGFLVFISLAIVLLSFLTMAVTDLPS